MTAEEEEIIKLNINGIMEQWEDYVPEMRDKLNKLDVDGEGKKFYIECPVNVGGRTLMLATLCDPKTGIMQVSHYKWEDTDED